MPLLIPPRASRASRGLAFAAAFCLLLCAEPAPSQDPASSPPDDAALATVYGKPITQGDLEAAFLIHRIPPERQFGLRQRMLQDLVDQRLMADFLKSRKIQAAPEEIDARLQTIRLMIERSGRDPAEVLQKVGVTEAMLRRSLELPLAWNQHVRLVVTEQQLADHFAANRQRFDGTRLHVRQIVNPLAADATEAQRTQARETLRMVRQEIVDGGKSFADAAREHSKSPSAEQGGDMGWLSYGGRAPREIADVAFSLKPGEVSEPFESRFGVHLVTVEEAEPGDLSLEDARPDVLAELSRKLWDEQLAKQREQAKIEWKSRP